MTVPPGIALAHARAATRLRDANGSIRAAFDGLETGVTFDDLLGYVEPDFHARALQLIADDDERFHARLVGYIAGAALTIVMSDRVRGGRVA
jgi:hypothetical protein